MHERDRLRQIRVLRERLERLPASAERDWMLGEVRRRVVDVESGLRAAPLRPLVEEIEADRLERAAATAAAVGPELPKQAPSKLSRTRPSVAKPRERSVTNVAAAAIAAASPAPQETPLQEGLTLCLDDDVMVFEEPGRHRLTSPWARGLRG